MTNPEQIKKLVEESRKRGDFDQDWEETNVEGNWAEVDDDTPTGK